MVCESCKEEVDKLQPEYELIKISLRRSKSVNIDETGIRVGGLNFYL